MGDIGTHVSKRRTTVNIIFCSVLGLLGVFGGGSQMTLIEKEAIQMAVIRLLSLSRFLTTPVVL